MKYKVMGNVFVEGKKRTICYDTFDEYSDAYDYKEWLGNSDSWKECYSEDKPYMIYIKEIKTEGDKYFDEAMSGDEEQDDY